MFLNSTEHLGLLGQMKAHALDVYEVVQRGNFDEIRAVISDLIEKIVLTGDDITIYWRF